VPHLTRITQPGPAPGTVRLSNGEVLVPPGDWALLPPGDAALTGRVKKGPHWAVQEKRRNKIMSLGVWAPAATIEQHRHQLLQERADPAYSRKLAASRHKRALEQETYVEDFAGAVLTFLAFTPPHAHLAKRLAAAVTAHATPVGSGTVARTKRIPLETRARAAVIAWLRHATTTYDSMVIPRIKGARRETRSLLAKESLRLLHHYRTPGGLIPSLCPLKKALDRIHA